METFVHGAEFLAAAAAKSLVLLAAAMMVALLWRRRSAALLHGVWSVGLGACLLGPATGWLAPRWTASVLPSRLAGPAAPRPSSASASRPMPRSSEVSVRQTSTIQHSPVSAPSVDRSPAASTSPADLEVAALPARASSTWLSALLVVVWAVGLAIGLLRLVGQTVAVRRLVRQASEIDHDEWRDVRREAEAQLGLRRRVSLLMHRDSPGPLVAGMFRPVVLLPGDAFSWPRERKKLVLLHELSHVLRWDLATQTMAAVTCAVYWFNPLAWFAAARMQRLREIACDDAVLRNGGPVPEYAQTLLDIAKKYRCRAVGTAVAMATTNQMEGRIRAVLSSTRNRAALTASSTRMLVLAALACAALVGTGQLSSRRADATEGQQAADTKEKAQEQASRPLTIAVLDQDGRPLEGALIFVSAWAMPGEPRVPNRNLTTDDRGRAELSLPKRVQILRLWPSMQGYVPQFINFEDDASKDGPYIPEGLEFRLQPGSELRGRVVDEQGKPIAGAKVQVMVVIKEPAEGAAPQSIISTWLTDEDFNCPTPKTDADGYWTINNAPAPRSGAREDFEFRLQVTHPEYAGDTRWGELQRKQGITTADLRAGTAKLTLERGVAITGLVTGPEGQPVTEGLVIWNDRPYWAQGTNEAALGPAGRFETKHLAPGEYPVTVLAPGFAPERRMVNVHRELGELNLRLEPGNAIQIKVVDHRGQPVPDAHVRISQWRGTEAIYNVKHSNVPPSGIPDSVDAEGLFDWSWAPKDGVTYQFSAEGYALQQATLVAKSTPHVIRLSPRREVVGTVTDATTGRPLKAFSAMPVIVFAPDFFHTRKEDAKAGADGRYELPLTGSADPNDHYRVRFEADGYRSVVSSESFGPNDGRSVLDVALQPANARKGQVVDAQGRPVEGAVVLEASPTVVPDTSNGVPESQGTRPIPAGAAGRFQLLATTERTLVRAYDERGFAEKLLAPEDDAVGELRLQQWATIAGRLLQAGRPVPDQEVYFRPLIQPGLLEPRFQDTYHARTDKEGRFSFKRVPPIQGELTALLGPWQDSPLTSSEALPLRLNPGENRAALLGGEGAAIRGRVAATGRSNDELSKQWSLNYLVSRSEGVPYPAEAPRLSFEPSGPLQAAWLRQPDFQAWLATRRHYFVKLADDGGLQIHGAPPGDYDLVIQLYEEPTGCLVETIGEKVMPVTMPADGDLDLGTIDVPCRIGPRTGADMRAYKFTDADGQVRSVNDLQGRFVLLHVWATWCNPCIQAMPSLKAAVEGHASAPLTVVGLNVDEDVGRAQAVANQQGLVWAQNYLGADSDLMRQLATSSVPAYYLIGQDGKLVGSANQWEEIEQQLYRALERR